MKKIITFLFLSVFMVSSFAVANDKKPIKHSDSKEVGKTEQNINVVYGQTNLRGGIPDGSLPDGVTGFFDYVTNGNSIKAVAIFGDTIVVSFTLADSTDPTGTTSRKSVYQVSYNNGATWLAAPVAITTGVRSAYPDIHPVFGGLGRTIVLNGRAYTPAGGSNGVAWVEQLLGLGSITQTPVPQNGATIGRDFFAADLGSNKIGGAYFRTLTATDTLSYVDFDYSTNTMGTQQIIATGGSTLDANARQYVAASSDGNNVSVMWWMSLTGSVGMYYKESTDGGSTFGSATNIHPEGLELNGDSTSAWFGADMIYKPGTSDLCVAWNTLAPGNFGTQRGYKLLFYSPGINGGNPVVIADRTNYPFLMDTAVFNNNFVNLQVGATAVSHPSLAYSDDGSRLFCVYSGIQTDTLDAFNRNDIYSSYSDDNGATWSAPQNLTQTPDWDEMYPSISKTGNSTSQIHIVYQSTIGPGCQSFSDLAPTYRVWEVYRKYNPENGNPINIQNISSEVPSSFSLKQNYPNPFNPSTSIRFDIANTTRVTLKIYDINGREVAVLANNETVTPGLKEITFDGSNLASGVYFYTLSTGDFKETKKMTLLK